jgi:CheY-like chemotaxis protein
VTTILAVDDSATMRRCLEIAFAGTEFQLATCDSATAALERVKTLKPELVLLDVTLPPTDGYELCTTLKLAQPDLPVLLLSSKQSPFDPSRGAKADAHVDKPFDTQALQDKARELIRARGAARVTAQVASVPPPTQPRVPVVPERAARIPAPPQTPLPPPPPPQEHAPSQASPTQPGWAPAQAGQPAGWVPAATTPLPPQAARRPDSVRRTLAFEIPQGQSPAALAHQVAQLTGGAATQAATASPGAATAAATSAGAPAPAATPAMEAHRANTMRGMPSPFAGEERPQRTRPSDEPEVKTQPRTSVEPLAAAARSATGDGADFVAQLRALGLSEKQVEGVVTLSRQVVERVAWEVVPVLAETIIKEEIARLTRD